MLENSAVLDRTLVRFRASGVRAFAGFNCMSCCTDKSMVQGSLLQNTFFCTPTNVAIPAVPAVPPHVLLAFFPWASFKGVGGSGAAGRGTNLDPQPQCSVSGPDESSHGDRF
jgi:hypothetical protein